MLTVVLFFINKIYAALQWSSVTLYLFIDYFMMNAAFAGRQEFVAFQSDTNI
jgi:hypothetical protein